MKKSAFTLMEVMVVVIIIGVLGTLGFPAYQNAIDSSNSKVCKANLDALQTGLDIYAMEHDRIPGDLSQLPAEYIRTGLAKVQKEGGWSLKFAYWVVELQERGLAYAGLMQRLQGGVVMSCPAARGGHSYGLWSGLSNITAQEYREIPSGQALIADSDANTFSSLSAATRRHATHAILSQATPYALAACKVSLIQSGSGFTKTFPRVSKIKAVIDSRIDTHNDDAQPSASVGPGG
jgi:prepilin-type N-terminal cleavage/methylation domain-containing protein